MKVAIWIPRHYDTSVKIYVDNIRNYLEKKEITFIEISEKSSIPEDVNIVWVPNCTGAQYPNKKILFSKIKWIVTLHGAANLSLPLRYTYTTFFNRILGLFENFKRRCAWFLYKNKVAHIITVSAFAKNEIIEELKIDPKKISVIYHGYNDELFTQHSGKKTYFFNISMYQKVKNVDRLIEAYSQIPLDIRIPMIVVCPNYPTKNTTIEKLTIISEKITQKEVAKYMEDAYCFVFPSIRESFGLPIVEAFGCGVPVITSNTSALKEITQDAGILVDPFSVTDIKDAMIKVIENNALRNELAQKAIQRAVNFSWAKSAQLHYEIFKRIADG